LKGDEGNGLIKGDDYETNNKFVQGVHRHWLNHYRDAGRHRIVSCAHFTQHPSRASAHVCALSFAKHANAAFRDAYS
jgi:hypothetical protein